MVADIAGGDGGKGIGEGKPAVRVGAGGNGGDKPRIVAEAQHEGIDPLVGAELVEKIKPRDQFGLAEVEIDEGGRGACVAGVADGRQDAGVLRGGASGQPVAGVGQRVIGVERGRAGGDADAGHGRGACGCPQETHFHGAAILAAASVGGDFPADPACGYRRKAVEVALADRSGAGRVEHDHPVGGG